MTLLVKCPCSLARCPVCKTPRGSPDRCRTGHPVEHDLQRRRGNSVVLNVDWSLGTKLSLNYRLAWEPYPRFREPYPYGSIMDTMPTRLVGPGFAVLPKWPSRTREAYQGPSGPIWAILSFSSVWSRIVRRRRSWYPCCADDDDEDGGVGGIQVRGCS